MMNLVTAVNLGDPGSSQVDVSCELLLEFESGSRIPLITDRGWGSTEKWPTASLADLESVARMVVGPDGATGDLTEQDMERGHWSSLARQAQAMGVPIQAGALAELPLRVEFSDEVIARVSRPPRPA
ncbi:hypothetical protein GCM10025862_16820 [Arsenicicoccus piscis]|uniref:Uncharacterized protein n=1 Tax=Arsenicicoccus piscis TaxID=673954 RepID=A0ABQ6HMI7_9MICO|nr:hypothetical protein GCM10025862_16820 [Arsenicicoccus piscis]